MSDAIRVTDVAGVRAIRLTRPAKRNAMDLELLTALAVAFETAGDAGAVALLAEGEHFCVGGDVSTFAAADPKTAVGELAGAFHRAVRAMRAGPVVVAGVRGWAAGAGMSLVLASDLVVAGESASLRAAYPGIGLTPDGGMSWLLPQLVGRRRALSLILQNTVITAARAQEWGIVDDTVPDDFVDAETLSLAGRVADGPREAMRGIKRLVLDAAGRALDDQLDAEAASIAERAASAEGHEGVAAFLERRTPDYGSARGAVERTSKILS